MEMKSSGTRYYQQFDGEGEDSNQENVMVHVVPDAEVKCKFFFCLSLSE